MFILIYRFNGEILDTEINYESRPRITDTVSFGDKLYTIINEDIRDHPTDQVMIVIYDINESTDSNFLE